MNKYKLLQPAILAAGILLAGASHAALVNAPLPTNAYITFEGAQWAWASPLEESNIDLGYQSQFGWRLPTAAELANAPTALDFVFPGANVPLAGVGSDGANFQYGSPGGDAACASPYFSNSYYHCDWGNGFGSGGFDPQAWNYGVGYNESLVIRAVPEPATYALLAAGLALVGGLARRRRA